MKLFARWRRKEPERAKGGRSTMGLGGHGLLLAPVCPSSIVLGDDGELSIVARLGEILGTASIRPGSSPATGSGSLEPDGELMTFPNDGPTIAVSDGLTVYDMFHSIDAGLGESPWQVMGPGFVAELPRGTITRTASEHDDDPFFEVHIDRGGEQFVSFDIRPCWWEEIQIGPAPGQTLIREEYLDGRVRVQEFEYAVDGAVWRQTIHVVGLAEDRTGLVKAQAGIDDATRMRACAEQLALTMGALT